jgi:uncharacterized membrane-anchored protein
MAAPIGGSARADGGDELPPRAATRAPEPATPAPAATQAAPAAAPATQTPTAPAPTAEPAGEAAAPPPAAPVAEPAGDSFAPRTGPIDLADGAVRLTVPSSFAFYPEPVARQYLTDAGAAPPSGIVLGVIAPTGLRPGASNFWGSVVSWDPIGYVPATEPAMLESGGVENAVRTARAQQQRRFNGLQTDPVFDGERVAVTWAERMAPPAGEMKTVRHEQRVLGRRGAVGLTSVVSPMVLGQVEAVAPQMRGMVGFPAGGSHGDFVTASDPAPRFTLVGVVTGQPMDAPVAAAASTGGRLGGAMQYLPWIVGAALVVGIAAWLLLGRRGPRDEFDDEEDANLRPREVARRDEDRRDEV